MNDEFKDLNMETPSLTLDPVLDDSGLKIEEPKSVPDADAVVFNEQVLSPEEQKMIDDFVKKIDITNSGIVMQYGAGAQKKIADFPGQIILGHKGERIADHVGGENAGNRVDAQGQGERQDDDVVQGQGGRDADGGADGRAHGQRAA